MVYLVDITLKDDKILHYRCTDAPQVDGNFTTLFFLNGAREIITSQIVYKVKYKIENGKNKSTVRKRIGSIKKRN